MLSEARRAFIEFAPSFKTAEGRTFWYAEGWIGGQRYEFAAEPGSEGYARMLCYRLNTVVEAALSPTPSLPQQGG